MSDKLLPCPFCGSEEIHFVRIHKGNGRSMMVCRDCQSCGPSVRIKIDGPACAAIAAWNARAKPRGAGSVMPATIPWQGRRLTHIAHMDTEIKDGDVYLTVYDSDLRPIGVARFTREGCRRQAAALAAAADRAAAALDL